MTINSVRDKTDQVVNNEHVSWQHTRQYIVFTFMTMIKLIVKHVDTSELSKIIVGKVITST